MRGGRNSSRPAVPTRTRTRSTIKRSGGQASLDPTTRRPDDPTTQREPDSRETKSPGYRPECVSGAWSFGCHPGLWGWGPGSSFAPPCAWFVLPCACVRPAVRPLCGLLCAPCPPFGLATVLTVCLGISVARKGCSRPFPPVAGDFGREEGVFAFASSSRWRKRSRSGRAPLAGRTHTARELARVASPRPS